MTGNEYQKLAMRTNDNGCTERLNNYVNSEGCATDFETDIKVGDLINGVLGLCGESGEVSEHIKKAIFHKHILDKEKIVKELGDVLWYVAMCCHSLNVSLDDVMQGNIDKLKKRYPNGFSTTESINRKEAE